MKIIISLLLVIFLNQIVFSQTQKELYQEICDDMVKIEKEMETVVQKIRKKYYDDTLLLAKLATSQKRWLQYRDAQIEMKFPAKDKQWEYGSMYPTCYCLERISITQQRIKDLEMWAKGVIEGDVCPGSVLKEDE